MFSAKSGPAAARLRLAPFGSFAAVTPFAGANVTPPCECRQPARRYGSGITSYGKARKRVCDVDLG
jgi:hypothetical protein